MKHSLLPHEVDQNAAQLREWFRLENKTESGQFQLGRLMTLSYNLNKGKSCSGMTNKDISDIGWLAYHHLQSLMANAGEVDAMNEELK